MKSVSGDHYRKVARNASGFDAGELRNAADELDTQQKEIERLQGADKLAYEVALECMEGRIHARTRLSDQLESYLEIGGLNRPTTLPEWMEQYEAAEAAGGE